MRTAQINRVLTSIRTRIAAHALLLRTFRNQDGDGVIAFAKAMDVAYRRFNTEKPDDQPLFTNDVRTFHPDCEADWEDQVEYWLEYYRAIQDQLEGRENRSIVEVALSWGEEEPELDLVSLFSL